MSAPKLLIALHDVTPVHRARIERAERLLADLGVRHVAYLLVPDYHGQARADASSSFVEWCRAPRPFDVQWLLHGYFHDDRRAPSEASAYSPTWRERLAAQWTTAGEAECVGLGPRALRARLRAGTQVFESCVGAPPAGFVAPAWLFNRHLLPALAELRFALTESHSRVFHVARGCALTTPVITWATRTWIRRHGSLVTASVGRRLFRDRPLVRIALHPFDFDHPATVASITQSLAALCRDRAVARYDEALFDSIRC